jgi:hypothetical protein
MEKKRKPLLKIQAKSRATSTPVRGLAARLGALRLRLGA